MNPFVLSIVFRIRQLSLSVQSVAANLADIGKRHGQEKQTQEMAPETENDLVGGFLSLASCEFLSLLVLRLFLLADKPRLAMLFCEAMGCWHVALLVAKISTNSPPFLHSFFHALFSLHSLSHFIAGIIKFLFALVLNEFDANKIWQPELADSVILAQFEEYFSRRSFDIPNNAANDSDNQLSVEDLVVAANISGCLNNALIVKVFLVLSHILFLERKNKIKWNLCLLNNLISKKERGEEQKRKR